MSEAPAELWMRPNVSSEETSVRWYRTLTPDEPDAVRYVRADLYEALQAQQGVTPAQLNPVQQGYNQWPPKQLNVPTAWPVPMVRLSDEDVARIADAVVLRLHAEADYPR